MPNTKWMQKIVKAEDVLEEIKPGSRIFFSSGVSAPLHMIQKIAASDNLNLQDLEIIQLITIKESDEALDYSSGRFRMKTFNVGESITREFEQGSIDFIPANLVEIPAIFSSGAQGVDIAVVQTSPPDARGYMSLGIAVDVASIVMKKADIVVAEINPRVPDTHGETVVHMDQFHYHVKSDMPLPERKRLPFDEMQDRIGWHVSNLVEDGASVSLYAGRTYDAIARHLVGKKRLGIVTHVISDWVMDLIEKGAIAKDRSRFSGGLVTASYCFGSEELYKYVDRNPLIEFHPIAILANPFVVRRVKYLVSIMSVKRIDVTGESVIFHAGDNLISGYESKLNFAIAATFSRKGKAIVVLRSVDREGKSNIVIHHREDDALYVRSTLGVTRYVVTEYGVANLFGKSVRERVLAMIEIAHPRHREQLLKEAKEHGFAYPDQIYDSGNAENFPHQFISVMECRDGTKIRLRPIKQSDEEKMRRFYYQFSDESIYFRYFTKRAVMPHKEMQKYVNIDYDKEMSIVGIVEKDRTEKIVAEARYAYNETDESCELAFTVDEDYQGRGIGTYLVEYIIQVAVDMGYRKLSAYVLPENRKMLHVFRKGDIKPKVTDEDGIFKVSIDVLEDG